MADNISEKKQIVIALAKLQGAIKNPIKDTDNPFFKSKYADLASVWDSVRGLLAANELAFVQLPATDGNKVSVTGILMHSSGEQIESTITSTAKDAMPQSIGSCISYLRRYQISCMLGIASADDDGQEAHGQTSAAKPRSKAQERPGFSTGISVAEHEAGQRKSPEPAKPPLKDLGDFESVILSCKVVSNGVDTKGKAWTKYEILTDKYPESPIACFDGGVYDEARSAVTMKEPVMVKTELTPRGVKVVGFGPVAVLDTP